ncbi:MAG: phosphate-starvation-inducible PsiE family protein [Nitrosomonadales bacterium]|nr:phosphate-starvation-inducible PsiE family protein [Nitrosomonadales bacterium]
MSDNKENTKSFISRIFHRFETIVTIGIVAMISVMILAAFWGLIIATYNLVLHGAFDTLEHKAFQSAFGMVMTLLIAIEFNRTIMHAYLEEGREVIVKTVVLVSILAVSRQFIVFEINTISPLTLAALAFALLSLGIVYWLMGRTSPSGDNTQNERR